MSSRMIETAANHGVFQGFKVEVEPTEFPKIRYRTVYGDDIDVSSHQGDGVGTH